MAIDWEAAAEPSGPSESSEPDGVSGSGNLEVEPDRPGPDWSTAVILPLAVTIGVAIAVAVFWVSPAPVLIEWQLTILVLSVCLTAFLTVGIYRGVHLATPKRLPRRMGLLDGGWNLGSVDGFSFDIGSGEGCAVFLLVIVFVIVALIAMQFLLMILPPVIYALYRLCDALLRKVLVGERSCSGSWPGSLGLGLVYAGCAVGVLVAGTWLVRAAWIAATHL
jgi:hypothetical protein